MSRLYHLKLSAVLLIALLLLLSPVVHAAANMPLTSDDPVNYTPRIIGGWVGETDPDKPYRTVLDFTKVGDDMYAGGIIDKVADSSGQQYERVFSNLIRFNSTNGTVDTAFHPEFKGVAGGDGEVINGVVNALQISPDNKSLYVGGEFISVDGVSRYGLVKWNLQKNKLDTDFDAHLDRTGNGKVYDLKYTHGQLLVATSSGSAKSVLLSVNPKTGDTTSYADISIEEPVRAIQGIPRVYKIAISPNNNKAVIIGDFRHVGGEERLQLAMLDLNDSSLTLSKWYAYDVMRATTPPSEGDQTETSCGISRSWCLMDVDWSPDGKWFAIAASGGPGMTYPSLKDGISRFENNDDSNNYPTWINYSQGDTFHSVRVTKNIVYSGGHNKYLNGKVIYHGEKQDVKRENHSGLGAIRADSGRAVTHWNHGDSTQRGEGWRGMLVVPDQGLWVGGDTDYIHGEPRNRLGLMPVE